MNTAASFYHRLTPSTHTATDLWITLCDVFISQVVIAKYWWSFLFVLYEKYMICFSREEFKVIGSWARENPFSVSGSMMIKGHNIRTSSWGSVDVNVPTNYEWKYFYYLFGHVIWLFVHLNHFLCCGASLISSFTARLDERGNHRNKEKTRKLHGSD